MDARRRNATRKALSIDAKYTFVDDKGKTQPVSCAIHFANSLGQRSQEFQLVRGIANASKHFSPATPAMPSPSGAKTATSGSAAAFREGVDARERIRAAPRKEGLSYSRGGHIHGAALSGPSRSLAQRIKAEGIPAIEIEYERAYKAIDSDPGAAVTAACAILESVCKSYLEAQGHALPRKQVLGALWPQVASYLDLSPKDVADDDLKRILQGLYSIGDGVAALRTHAGSAHGHAQGKSYRLAPRHARLAVHAVHRGATARLAGVVLVSACAQ